MWVLPWATSFHVIIINSYAHVVSQFIEEDKMDVDELKQLIARIESGRKEE